MHFSIIQSKLTEAQPIGKKIIKICAIDIATRMLDQWAVTQTIISSIV